MCPRALVLALPKMPDDDEKELATLAKRVLAMPPKPRDESKIGKPKAKAELKMPYQPGTLTAVAYAKGREVARKVLETVGPPAQLRLRAERSMIAGDVSDLGYVHAEVCDANGRPVPDAAVPLTFAASGPARLLAAASANPYGIESFQDERTRSYHGVALAIIQPTARRGEAVIRVTSPGLRPATTTIRMG